MRAMGRCRILVIPAIDWLGGPENRLHRFFEDVGHPDAEVHVVHFPLFESTIRTSRLWVHRAPCVLTRRRTALFYLLNLFPLWLFILHLIRKHHIHVVVSTNPVLVLPVMLLKRALGVRVVFDYVDDISGLASQYVPRTLRSPVAAVIRKFMSVVVHDSDTVIVSSEPLRQRVLKATGVAPVYIPNGVTVHSFAPPDSHEGARLVVGYVGGVHEWSGVDDLIRSYPAVARVFPTVEYHIFGIGGNEAAVKELADVHDGVFVHGHISYDEIPAIMRRLSVGVIPFVKSPLTEVACPMKLFEYWAADIPVVSRDLVEVRRLAGDAVLFFHDVQGLSEAIVRVLSDRALARRLVLMGRERAKAFDWARLAEDYFAVIAAMC